ILAPAGEYVVVLSTDSPKYGGYGNIDENVHHLTQHDPVYAPVGREWLQLYLPPRSAQVLRMKKS
ncbi:MAG: alpha amylase C-terminal domain-containing protein, partial [Duncaniella freteri]|nr:alpha amylase C-terminal domain-containing protein [Duncaniella freteri]